MIIAIIREYIIEILHNFMKTKLSIMIGISSYIIR